MKQILIVGLGLIGGSYAKAINKLGGYRIDAYDMDSHILEQAKQSGVIQNGFSEVDQQFSRYDLVIIALHPSATIDFMKKHCYQFANSNTVVCDMAGLQGVVISELQPYLKEMNIAYISLHPMAGRERSGYEMAIATLFKEKSCLYTNVTAKEEELHFICDLHRSLGFRHIQSVDAVKHDEMIAYTSQLPHVVSVAFMNSCQARDVEGFTGGSFEDMTRVADINSTLWSELFSENKEALLQEIQQFKTALIQIEEAIKSDKQNELVALMKQSSAAKQSIKAQLLKEVWENA